MSDSQEKGFMGQAGVERVGDTIHRERLTRNIQLETIARDLKLNAEYIRGIEESNYGALPAVAYVRVYIKTIAKYLGLNGEALLEQFSKEMNIEVPDPERERRDTISVKVQGTKKTNPFLPLLYILIALVLVALLLKNGNRQESETADQLSAQESLKIEIPADTGDVDSLPKGVSALVDSVSDSSKAPMPTGDSAVGENSTKKNDSAKVNEEKKTKLDSLSAAKEQKKTELKPVDEVVKNKKKMSFQLEGKTDSSYVVVFADGKKVFSGVVHRKDEHSFIAKDSLNIKIGRNGSVRYKRNGVPLNIEGAGLKVMKITDGQIELWRMHKWNSVFEGR